MFFWVLFSRPTCASFAHPEIRCCRRATKTAIGTNNGESYSIGRGRLPVKYMFYVTPQNLLAGQWRRKLMDVYGELNPIAAQLPMCSAIG